MLNLGRRPIKQPRRWFSRVPEPLQRRAANHSPLTPIQFVERAAAAYPNHTSIVHPAANRRFTWAHTWERSQGLAAAVAANTQPDDCVAAILPNIPEMLEAHYGVPLAGRVLTPLNTRLDAQTLRYTLEHSNAKVLLVDRAFSEAAKEALDTMEGKRPLVIDVTDPGDGLDEGSRPMRIGSMCYEEFITSAEGALDSAQSVGEGVTDEWDSISLNYTSGTTGKPKGVSLHHRGAYLTAVSNHMVWSMKQQPTYLWTLPMFHCNGWCFPWTIAALGGTHVCLRKVEGEAILQLVKGEKVTHMCGAPIVVTMLLDALREDGGGLGQDLALMTAASSPPESVLAEAKEAGIDITHVYGLTEVYGPATVCAWHKDWNDLDIAEQAKLKARQGVRYHAMDGLCVADPDTLEPVPADGETLGEILMRGNMVMKGYRNDAKATDEAFKGGWFHTGDLAVMHPNGYIQIRDRAKDLVISGGENISSVEVENALLKHPKVKEAAVVALPDEKWGEVPCAFVVSETLSDREVIEHCKNLLPRYMAPKAVVFEALPKSNTGKILKAELRIRALEMLKQGEVHVHY